MRCFRVAVKSVVDKKTIRGLLIEDDADDAELFMMLMKQARWPAYQFAFEWAPTLKAGFEALSRGEIEIVLLDLKLPDSSGVESVRKLRARFSDVPIVVLTGLRDEAVGIEALLNGAQDYQVKGTLDGDMLKRTLSYAVARHRAQTRMGTIIHKSADGIVVVDANGLVRHINPAADALFQSPPGHLLGKPFPHRLAPGFPVEIRIEAEAGEHRIAEMRVSAIEWEDEAAWLALIRDITELRRNEQIKAEILERLRMDKLKDDLMSTVSHEMRNPLSIIKVASSFINEAIKGPLSKRLADMISVQDRNIQRLEKIVARILDLSRLESGVVVPQFQSVDAGRLVEDTVRGFRLIAKQRSLSILAEIPPDLPPLRADPEFLIQLLTNLLDNAMRYARSRITVRAAVAETGGQAKHVEFSVRDDGAGVPKARRDEIFNKFVQADRRRNAPGYKGTGLGLAICKELVELLGGRIWIGNAEEGGAAFHFVLPLFSGQTNL